MSLKLQAAMASGLRDEIKPRRFDLTMSRRTRRPAAAATLATSCQEQPRLICLSDHLQSRQPELDAHHQVHDTSEQRSEETTKEQASLPQTFRLQNKGDENEEECLDNSRRFSLQELIDDEAVDGVKDGGTEENAATAAAAVRDVAVAPGAAAAAGAAEKRPRQQVAGRRVIGIMRRYVKVRSIKSNRASPEKNATPVC